MQLGHKPSIFRVETLVLPLTVQHAKDAMKKDMMELNEMVINPQR